MHNYVHSIFLKKPALLEIPTPQIKVCPDPIYNVNLGFIIYTNKVMDKAPAKCNKNQTYHKSENKKQIILLNRYMPPDEPIEANESDVYKMLERKDTVIEKQITNYKKPILVHSEVTGLKYIEGFIKAILSSDQLAYELAKNKHGKNELNKLPLANFMYLIKHAENIQNQSVTYSPRVTLFFDAYHRNFQSDDYFEFKEAIGIRTQEPIWKSFNDLILYIREIASSKTFIKKEADWKGNARKRIKSSNKYIDGLIDIYSKISVIRIDFHPEKVVYPGSVGKPVKPVEPVEPPEQPEQPEQSEFTKGIKKLEKILNNQRHNKLFKDKIGQIIKIEYAPNRGLHFHVIFFFNGHQVKSGSHKAHEIGMYWINNITQGKGTFFNCNANRRHYKRDATGKIHYSDKVKIGNLRYAVSYLAKSDLYLMHKDSPRQKLFRMGQLPRRESGDQKLGRPRKYKEGD